MLELCQAVLKKIADRVRDKTPKNAEDEMNSECVSEHNRHRNDKQIKM